MKLLNVNHVDDYKEALSHMQIDLRKKMQKTAVFVLAKVKNKDKANIAACTEVIIMRDKDNLCNTKENFDKIDFEIINRDEFDNYLPEYFDGKYICEIM